MGSNVVECEPEMSRQRARSLQEEIINLICGAWIVVAPLILGFSGNLRLWHFGLGGLVVIITLFEFWQDEQSAGVPNSALVKLIPL